MCTSRVLAGGQIHVVGVHLAAFSGCSVLNPGARRSPVWAAPCVAANNSSGPAILTNPAGRVPEVPMAILSLSVGDVRNMSPQKVRGGIIAAEMFPVSGSLLVFGGFVA